MASVSWLNCWWFASELPAWNSIKISKWLQRFHQVHLLNIEQAGKQIGVNNRRLQNLKLKTRIVRVILNPILEKGKGEDRGVIPNQKWKKRKVAILNPKLEKESWKEGNPREQMSAEDIPDLCACTRRVWHRNNAYLQHHLYFTFKKTFLKLNLKKRQCSFAF